MQDTYKQTKKRTTNELENDETTLNSKNILLYGWDYTASAKTRLVCTSTGLLKVIT